MSKAGGEAAADGDKKFIVSFSDYTQYWRRLEVNI